MPDALAPSHPLGIGAILVAISFNHNHLLGSEVRAMPELGYLLLRRWIGFTLTSVTLSLVLVLDIVTLCTNCCVDALGSSLQPSCS